MRIIGGRHRGRKLLTPPDARIRPTSDRARQALFDLLEHRQALRGVRFLDLCAGSGAVGLEAFSRGAADVLLVDSDPDAIRLIERNRTLFGEPAAVRVLRADAARLPRPDRGFDIAFLDPPYRSALAGPVLERLLDGWLDEAALVVVELAAKEPLAVPGPFQVEDDRRYGAARFVLLRPAGA